MKHIALTACTLLILAFASNAFAAEDKKPPPKPTKAVAVLETSKGVIKFELFEKDMPITTKNFIELADKKFYNGLTFHRLEPGFVIQGGNPEGTGRAGSAKTIKLEINQKAKWDSEGQVGMARGDIPDSATSQFFITLGNAFWLNPNPRNAGYALFGKVIAGMDVVKKLRVGDKMIKVYISRVPVK